MCIYDDVYLFTVMLVISCLVISSAENVRIKTKKLDTFKNAHICVNIKKIDVLDRPGPHNERESIYNDVLCEFED